jgi:type I restriction enzyme S subunit
MSEEATLDEFTEQEESTGKGRRNVRLGPVTASFPEDWSVQKMDSLYREKSIGTNERGTGEQESIPFVKMGDLKRREVAVGNPEEEIEQTDEMLDEYRLEKGDFLFNTRNTPDLVGKTAVWDSGRPAVYDNNLLRVRFKSDISSLFVNYFLSSGIGWRQARGHVHGTTSVAAIYDGEFDKLQIPVPRAKEQRRIASVLYNVDQAIQKTEKIIEQREMVKRGLMQDIFRYGIDSNGELRGTGDDSYRETKYGSVPEGWEIIPLQTVVPDDASITYGIVKPGDNHPNGVPVVKVENIMDGEIETSNLLHTDPEIHEKYNRAELQEGDLLFTIRGTVGRMAFVPEELEGANLTQDTARIRVEDANPRFVRYYLETATPGNFFERHTKGQAVQGINLEDLQEVPLHLPSREEQERIVGILDNHTEQLQNEREYRRRLQLLKQGLTQDLLSGKIRTTDTSIEVLDEVAQHG